MNVRSVLDRVRRRLDPIHAPTEVLGQPKALGSLLPYEAVLDELERPAVLLDDGSLGLVWELAPISHEVLTDRRLQERVGQLAQTFQNIDDPDVVYQLLFDSRPAHDFGVPAYASSAQTVAQDVMVHRIAHVRQRAQGSPAVRTMQRRLYVTLRLQGPRIRKLGGGWSPESALERDADRFARRVQRLMELAQILEDGLTSSGLPWERCGADGVLDLARSAWHSDRHLRSSTAVRTPHDPSVRLGDQVLRDFVQLAPGAVEVGGADCWEAVSWIDQPPHVYYGLFSVLLGLPHPHRCVVNLRPCAGDQDLTFNAQALKHATDERGSRHRTELQQVEQRRAYGEQLMRASVHLFVKVERTPLAELADGSIARTLANQLGVATRIPFVHERWAASALFLLCQPLAYTAAAASFTQRERRVLTGALGPYLPVFGGFPGTGGRTQLMQSRAGDPVWLSPRDSPTAPHMAVLASTGGGKSFFMANAMTAELAADPDSLVFIIDSITSYRVFGEVMGEDGGFEFACPPATFPNPFAGEIDELRLATLVRLLTTAITLEDPSFAVTSEHRQLLSAAILKAFGDVLLDAGTEYRDGALHGLSATERRCPRLTDVVDDLVAVAEAEGLSRETAETLRHKLGAYYGTGAYAQMFDQHAVETGERATARVTLYDLEGVSDDPVLATLTMTLCVSEVLRQIRRPCNRGRRGMLVIDEAGVLGSASPELKSFIQEAWKTFRKLGICCVGLTNEVDDYREKAAPRAIWANSPNKVLLRMLPDQVDKLGLADPTRGLPALVADEHLLHLVRTLDKRDGVYAHGLWTSDEVTGTFCYEPTGYDYWLAASKPAEVQTVRRVRDVFGSTREALAWLAETYPRGVRDEADEVVPLDEHDLPDRDDPSTWDDEGPFEVVVEVSDA